MFIVCVLWPGFGHASKIERVISPGGIEAWLIQDSSLPIIHIAFQFRVGSIQDPIDRPGTANLLGRMMLEGAGTRNSTDFAATLEDHSISLNIDVDSDSFGGTLRTLSVHRDLGFSLLSDALNNPRYDTAALKRVRDKSVTEIQQAMLNPQWQLGYMQRQSVYGDHPLAGRVIQSLKALPNITAKNMEIWRKESLTRDRLLVTAVGDITPDMLGQQLDLVFGSLAATAKNSAPARIALPTTGNTSILARTSPQARLSSALPGLDREVPDWFAAVILDRIYGGGGFQSRLMQKIRVERGLTYGIYSRLTPSPYASLMSIGTSTRPDAIADIIAIIRDEMVKIRTEGIDEKSLQDAKDFINGSFALNMTTTGDIAQILMSMRYYDLGIDYLERRTNLVNAVTLADVKRVAERLYRPELMRIVAVGTGITLTDSQIITPPTEPENGTAWVRAIEQKL